MALPEWPTLTEAEAKNADPQKVAEMFDVAKRYAEVAVRAGPGASSNLRNVRKGTLDAAVKCGRRALLMLDILLQADAERLAAYIKRTG